MEKIGLLLVSLAFVLLLLLGGCSDFDDQPGMASATATSTGSPVPTVMQSPTQPATPTVVPSPTADPGGWVWVLVETKLNPESKPTMVVKSEKSHTLFTAMEGGCVIDKIEIQEVTDTKVYEYQIDCSYDKPPREVWPGEEYRLSIACSGDLKYAAEGNSSFQGQGAVSYYYLVNPAHKQFLQPHEQQFWFRPWHPDYDGTTRKEWVFFGPWGELGDEFELGARCEGSCRTHWRYELQVKE